MSAVSSINMFWLTNPSNGALANDNTVVQVRLLDTDNYFKLRV